MAGINEYLQNDSNLQDYVYVHECYKFDRDVEFIVLPRSEALKTLARTSKDDQIDCQVKVLQGLSMNYSTTGHRTCWEFLEISK